MVNKIEQARSWATTASSAHATVTKIGSRLPLVGVSANSVERDISRVLSALAAAEQALFRASTTGSADATHAWSHHLRVALRELSDTPFRLQALIDALNTLADRQTALTNGQTAALHDASQALATTLQELARVTKALEHHSR